MDLIYTNAKRVDLGVLRAYALDLSFGADDGENDFEIAIRSLEPTLKTGAYLYIERTEYGGIVDGLKLSTNSNITTYMGRTWHGILNSKVIEPDSGQAYLTVSGDANAVLSTLISRLGLSDLFVAASASSGITISKYRFNRYCKGYDGIRAMLAESGAKLKIEWVDRSVRLSAIPIVDYTAAPVDGDMATLSIEQYGRRVNHLICLGRGELAEREVIHLYVDQFGRIGNTQYYTGLAEVVDVYENSNSEELRSDGIKRLKELRKTNKAEMDIIEDIDTAYDIGDIVGASDIRTGVSVSAAVTQKIVRINNGVVSTEYKTGSE